VALLAQLLLRLAFGLSLAMTVTSSRLVSSGFFRVHLLVVLGVCTAAALASRAAGERGFWLAAGTAVASYLGAVFWLAERPRIGKTALAAVTLLALCGAWNVQGMAHPPSSMRQWIEWLTTPVSGAVLGGTMAAMFLGHWYLNVPGMQLQPLRKLLILAIAAVLFRAVLCGIGAGWEMTTAPSFDVPTTALLALRWLAGLVGLSLLLAMAWQTLKIPNTQSATGILYVAVVGALAGELISELLSAGTTYPL